MNIGIVLYPTFGGSGVVATELGKALAEKGHKIHFITYSQPVRLNSFRDNIFYHEVSVSDYPLFEYQPYETVLTSKMVDVVKHEKLDLLHVHYAIPHASAAFMAQQILRSEGYNIPFITTLHGTDITLVGKDKSFEPVITFCLNQSNMVTAVSESLKRDTYKHFNTKAEIQVIPNFIPAFTESVKKMDMTQRRKYAADDERIICHVSNFRKVKRVEDVVRVFHKINQSVKSRLLLIGDGPERYNVELLCRELGTCDKVMMVGKIRDSARLMGLSDMFLLPSQTESFGLAALEAMAVGVPVISSNTGGIPEVNKHGFSGYLSDVGNIDEMAAYGISILKDDEVLKKFKKQATEQAQLFSLDKILPEYERLYERVLNEMKTKL